MLPIEENTHLNELPDVLFSEINKRKKKQTILSGIVISLIILSLPGTGVGVSILLKINTGLAYLGLAIMAIPFVLIVGGVVLIALKKNVNRKRIVLTISVSVIVSALIGIGFGVLYLLKLNTLLAYIVSAIIICIVIYIAINAIRNKLK